MVDSTLIATFIPTFFLVSISPGMCMTLALTLGMTIGLRKSLWMMLGELLGVATVTLAAIAGVSQLMINQPSLFIYLKLAGAAFLIYTAIQIWTAKHKLAVSTDSKTQNYTKFALFNQGLFTAISNPKGWAFMVSLLPPFINPTLDLLPQVSVLLAIILISELICMLIYASGGKKLRQLLQFENNLTILNRLSASLIFGVGLWLIVSIFYIAYHFLSFFML